MKYLYFLPITLILLFCVGMCFYINTIATMVFFGTLFIILGSLVLMDKGFEKL